MAWSLYTSKHIIHDDERGLLTRDGRFERLLPPGEFRAFDPWRRLAVETVKVVRTELPVERAILLSRLRPEIADNFKIVQMGANEVAIVSFDGEPKQILAPNTARAFWTTVTDVTVEAIDTTTQLRVERRHLDKIDAARTPNIVSALV